MLLTKEEKTTRPKSAAPSRSRKNRARTKMSNGPLGGEVGRPKTVGPRKTKKKKKAVDSTANLSPNSVIEKMRQRQTMHLLRVLEEEQQSEDRREKVLRGVKDPAEKRRLDKVFSVERAKASEKIVRITEDNELVLANKMAELGIIR